MADNMLVDVQTLPFRTILQLFIIIFKIGQTKHIYRLHQALPAPNRFVIVEFSRLVKMEPSTIALGSKREGQSILVTAAGKGENNNASASKAEIPLPSQLKRILKEVARTGACSWLSWEDDYRDIAGPGRGKSKNLQMLTSATTSSLRQSVSTNRGIASSSFSASASGVQPPPRKKHRNTIHKSNRMRFMNSGNFSKAGSNRKRPLLSIRPHLNTAATGIPFPAPGSACSGRTSGSEPDDSTQYECDSEGTSTTTTSEVSVERQRKNQQRLSVTSLGGSKRPAGKASMGEEIKTLQYHMTLQEAFRSAVEIVLDHFYRNRGGYKLSPAERCRNEALRVYGVEKATGHLLKSEAMSPEEVFHRRRERLVGMLRPNPSFDDKTALHQVCHDGPPFTIQRIAEVLVAPERVSTFVDRESKSFECRLISRAMFQKSVLFTNT